MKASAALAVGASFPALGTDKYAGLVNQIRNANLGEIRYIHIQCNRPDGPSLKDALVLVERIAGPIKEQCATACGDLKTRQHFLVHQALPNGGIAVLTSAHQPTSWGIFRGTQGDLDLG